MTGVPACCVAVQRVVQVASLCCAGVTGCELGVQVPPSGMGGQPRLAGSPAWT